MAKYFASGFSLVEMAVVLVILALVMGGLFVPISAQMDQRNFSNTRKSLDVASDALVGYAMANKHLPCPDKTAGANNGVNDNPNDGVEDFDAATGSCIVQEGSLPGATLGILTTDAWGRQLIYRVSAVFSRRPPLPTFGLASVGNIRICNQAACNVPRLTDTAVAVVISRGKNQGNCSTAPSPPACPDERENDDAADNDFVSHEVTATASANGEFDDLVVWMSANTLFNRMVAAGQLP